MSPHSRPSKQKRWRLSFLALFIGAIGSVGNTPLCLAESSLLESVKRNPEEAITLCNQFRDLNKQGISAGSTEAIKKVSSQRNLTDTDAEILSIYVIGLNCPDVR